MRTNIFRAVEAGATGDDMFGGDGGIRWGAGIVARVPAREDAEPHRRPAMAESDALHRERAARLHRKRSRRRI